MQNNMETEKPNTRTLMPKHSLGIHTCSNGAASPCHKLVVAAPQLRLQTAHRHRADGQGEKSAVLKDRTERIVSDAEIAA